MVFPITQVTGVGEAAVQAAIAVDAVTSYVVAAIHRRDIGRCRLDALLCRRRSFVRESRDGEPEGRSASKRNKKLFHFRSPWDRD